MIEFIFTGVALCDGRLVHLHQPQESAMASIAITQDNRDLSTTWLKAAWNNMPDAAVLQVNPWELVWNAIENAVDVEADGSLDKLEEFRKKLFSLQQDVLDHVEATAAK